MIRKVIYLALVAIGAVGITSAAIMSSGGDESAPSAISAKGNVKAVSTQKVEKQECSKQECSKHSCSWSEWWD